MLPLGTPVLGQLVRIAWITPRVGLELDETRPGLFEEHGFVTQGPLYPFSGTRFNFIHAYPCLPLHGEKKLTTI